MKVIKNSHHEQILRLSNDDAALLVSSGRWVYTSKFEARKAALRPRRSRPWLIGAALAAAAAGLLLWATGAHAADKSVPFRICLTLEQAIAVYKGKKIGTPRYRQVGKDQCWYIASHTPPKSEFIPRASGLAAKPARTETPAPERVQAVPVGSIPTTGASIHRTDFTVTLEDDATLALSGKPESYFSFDAYWNRMTGWQR